MCAKKEAEKMDEVVEYQRRVMEKIKTLLESLTLLNILRRRRNGRRRLKFSMTKRLWRI